MDLEFNPLTFVLESVSIAVLLYFATLSVYRLFLSPVANIPGPKLAALTQWYETYWEMFKSPGGQFLFHYRELHEKYGPIIRLSPREVHIQDSAFFHSLYSKKLTWDKPQYLANRFGTHLGLFPTSDHTTHHARRTALNPFFSKRVINDFSPHLQALMDVYYDRLSREWSGTSNVVRLDRMFNCYAADAVMKYCFGDSEYVYAPDFYCDFAEAMNAFLTSVHLVTQFPWIGTIINTLPKSFLAKVSNEVRAMHQFEQAMSRQVSHILKNGRDHREELDHKTIFTALLDSSLPREELSANRLQHEALVIVGAAVETTAHAMSVTTFHIADTPRIHQRLRKELVNAIHHKSEMLPLEKLERLPYLEACIQEGLRLAYGICQRAHRISDHISIKYGPYTIPPGTTVSMDNYSVAHDETIFPDSYSFIPERWLDNPQAPDGKPLSAYMVSFGRGARQCLGMPLALAEMYILLANLFRKFDVALYENDRTVVDCYSDYFSPRPRPGTRGLRARIQQVDH